MNGNTFGRIFRLTTFGESHGPGLGGIVDGCPAGLEISEADLQQALDERRPGQDGRGGAASTARSEKDQVRILSGVFAGKSTGAPIAFYVENENQRSADYEALAAILRPGHADLGFFMKHAFRDYRGGGRSSGRETLCRVAGGGIAEKILEKAGARIFACVAEFGGIAANLEDIENAAARPWFCPDKVTDGLWVEAAKKTRAAGDSLGGKVRVEIHGLPAGLGEPVFDKLDARLAYAFMGVGAVKGVEIGSGCAAADMKGSEHNDPILPAEAGLACGTLPTGISYRFASNNAGGVLGGISNGAPICVTASLKPLASISRKQRSMDMYGEMRDLQIGGRHDISVIPRVVPVLKAMAALCAVDFLLLQKTALL
ncbi:MAG: chorismate synthase [Desulfovibrio sp.]|nr:chorismate synthase [Desulfovibrio sp.]